MSVRGGIAGRAQAFLASQLGVSAVENWQAVLPGQDDPACQVEQRQGAHLLCRSVVVHRAHSGLVPGGWRGGGADRPPFERVAVFS